MHDLLPISGQAPTPFIGLAREFNTLMAEAHAPRANRWMVFGPRGSGKTRLMLEVGRTLGADCCIVSCAVSSSIAKEPLGASDVEMFSPRHAQPLASLVDNMVNSRPGLRLLVLDDIDGMALADPLEFDRSVARSPHLSVFMTTKARIQRSGWSGSPSSARRRTKVMELPGLTPEESRDLLARVGTGDQSVEAVLRKARGRPGALVESALASSAGIGLIGHPALAIPTLLGRTARRWSRATVGWRRSN